MWSKHSRSRFAFALFLALTLLLSTAIVAVASHDQPGRGRHGRGEVTVTDVEFRGIVTFETGYTFEDTEVGGLSSITYDARRDVYHAISDDPALIDPVRYYTMDIDLSDGQLDPGDVTFLDVTFLLDENGKLFEPSSVDPEGMVLGRPGQLYVSSEGIAAATPPIDPFIYRYNLNGRQTKEVPIPEKFLPVPGVQGVRQNLAFESLAVSPNNRYLFTVNEGALVQDGPPADLGQETLVRIVQYSAHRHRALHEYVYVADPVVEEPVPADQFRVSGVVELLALDNQGTFLVMERSFSVGAGNTVKIYEAEINGATDVSDIQALIDPSTGMPVPFEPLEKQLLVNFADFGIEPDNIEGMTLGPSLPDGRHSLIIVSDNNFAADQVTQVIVLALDLETEEH